MIDKRSVRSLIEDCKTQIFNCEEGMESYSDDPDQLNAFKLKITHYEFMINRLTNFL
jgi:hypothetical protein